MALSFLDNLRMLRRARQDALTDALTGLPNRRAFMEALDHALEGEVEPRLLALFDLDGFKRYNDAYGHPAGDALLHAAVGRARRRGRRPRPRLPPRRRRVLPAARRRQRRDSLLVDAARALEARGDGFDVTASYGVVRLPADADTPEEALHLADRRMYAAKEARPSSAGLQTRTVLLKVLSEREPDLHEHSSDVMALARGVARRLGLPVEERDIVARAAELHDIGKMAIPDAILNKPGPLDDREWRFMRRHTIIGEDILNVAPALQPVAALVRASHERWDGKGYPDGTSGDEIPRGARIVAVCDAFSAMVQDRPYQAGLSVSEAVAEIKRCAGTNFDPARGRGVRRRDPLRSGARVRRCLAAALLALACSAAAAPAAEAAPGDIAIADEGNWFGSTGRLVRVTPAGAADVLASGAPLRNPWAVAVAADGAMLLADEGAEAVFRITPAGAVTTVASGRELDDPVGIALAPGGGRLPLRPQPRRRAAARPRQRPLTKVADVRDAAGLAFDKRRQAAGDRRARGAPRRPRRPARSRPPRRARRSTARRTSPSRRTARCS